MTAPAPGSTPAERRERWPLFVHALGLATLGLYVYLGSRPGGRGPVLAYLYGPVLAGLAAALALTLALVWSALHRPVLQPGRLAAFLVAGAGLWLASFPLSYPSSYAGRPSTIRFQLPFEGTWMCRFGGTDRRRNGLVLVPDRCFGFLFDPLVEEPEHAGGRPLPTVLAPAAGRIVALGDGPRATDAHLAPGQPRRIVLELAPGRLLVLAGCDPVAGLALGDRVEVAEVLGVLPASAEGSSGWSGLMLYLQDAHGEGIPLRFQDFVAAGREVELGIPLGGQRVASGR